MAYELPSLPYAYEALEPHIDTDTLHFHHDKHHATYVTNLNKALEGQPDLAAMPLEKLMGSLEMVPENIRTAVRNNGGGVINHNVYFSIMGPNGGTPKNELAKAIDSAFGGFDKFKEQFSNAGLTRFGSGYAWLTWDGGKLVVSSSANQDGPFNDGIFPLMTMDVWEHAYYLKYQNRRADYIAAFWNVVNWDEVGRRFEYAKAHGGRVE